tara:strand:+ start:895 stop:1539 length:645 start_codon:yes stop_codon:yes gene_type:complete
MYKTLSLLIWPALYLLYSRVIISDNSETQKKLVINIVSATNCYSTVALGSLYYLTENPIFYQTSLLVNGSYFIWDTYRIILNNFQKEALYICHHIVAMCFFNSMDPDYSDIMYTSYYLAEVSNIFMYIIYHFLKTKNLDSKNTLASFNNLLLIQLIWYGFFRIPIASYILLYKKEYFTNIIYYSSCVTFLMGVKWWSGQLKGYQKSSKKYLELK